jgi:protein-tyrosine phosphatase
MALKDDLRRLNAYWVEKDRFLAGAYPGDPRQPDTVYNQVNLLADMGISYFFDLTDEGECSGSPYPLLLKETARQAGRRLVYQRLPILDMSVPPLTEMRRILNIVDQAMGTGAKIYLHCFGGRGRTGTVVGCYLVRHGANGGDALDTISRLRRGLPAARYDSPETFEQKTFVLNWGLIEPS